MESTSSKIPDKYLSNIFVREPNIFPESKSTTSQDDYGNYKEKQKIKELMILKKQQLPPKINNCTFFLIFNVFIYKLCLSLYKQYQSWVGNGQNSK